MYIYARIRKYVTGGADLPPPALNRVKKAAWKMGIKFRDEVNTCLKIVHQIFLAIKKYVKYLYISNNIFTMMSAPDKTSSQASELR